MLAKIIKTIGLLSQFNKKEKKHPFIECTSFPDDIKYLGWKQFNNWHFYDEYIFDKSFKSDRKLPKSSTNILTQLNELKQTLINPKSSLIDDTLGKSFSLRFFLHLVADIHQPLHATQHVDEKSQKGDAGGNAFPVKFPSAPNLHTAWDGCLKIFKAIKAPLDDKAFDYLDAAAKDLMTRYDRTKLKDKLAIKERKKWIMESKQLSKDFAYAIKRGETITGDYVKKATPVIEEQLAVGGFRLADILIESLGDGSILDSHVAVADVSDDEDDDRDSSKDNEDENQKLKAVVPQILPN